MLLLTTRVSLASIVKARALPLTNLQIKNLICFVQIDIYFKAFRSQLQNAFSFSSRITTINERFTSGGGNAFSGLDKSANGGIIKSGSDIVTISAIEQLIEQQHTGKGNPNAILTFDAPLNNRQKELIESLPEYDNRITVLKDTVNMADLSALTAKTGDEFAMFTKGNERTIIRGNSTMANRH